MQKNIYSAVSIIFSSLINLPKRCNETTYFLPHQNCNSLIKFLSTQMTRLLFKIVQFETAERRLDYLPRKL